MYTMRSALEQIKKSRTIFEFFVVLHLLEKYLLWLFPVQLNSSTSGYYITKCNSKSKYVMFFVLVFLYGLTLSVSLPECSHLAIKLVYPTSLSILLFCSLLTVLKRNYKYKDLLDIYKLIETSDKILKNNFNKRNDYKFYIYVLIYTAVNEAVFLIIFNGVVILLNRTSIIKNILITVSGVEAAGHLAVEIFQMWVVFLIASTKMSFISKTIQGYQEFLPEDPLLVDELIHNLNVLMKVMSLLMKSIKQAFAFSSLSVLLYSVYTLTAFLNGITAWKVCAFEHTVQIIIPASLFFLVTLVTSEITQYFDESYKHLIAVVIEIDHSNERIASVKKLFLLQMYLEKLDGRVCGMFRVDRSFLVQLLATTLTGVLFMYSLFPDLLENTEN